MPLCLSQISRIECCIIYKWTRQKTKLSYLKERSKSKRSYCDLLEQTVLFLQVFLRKLSRCSILDSGHVGMLGKMWCAIDCEY